MHYLKCNNNQLTTLDLSNCHLDYIDAHNQKIEVTVEADAENFANPIFYKNPDGDEGITINEITYPHGNLIAIPEGATFISFTTDDFTATVYDNPFSGTITIKRDGGVSIRQPEAQAIKVYSTAEGITVSNATAGETITVFNMLGVQVATARAAESGTSISLPQAGVYVVKVGGYTTKVLIN